ncbi:MAG TPA: type I restriction enzyme HsdR N-terminal domain-containing protein [Polyangia bacterium]|nr:type I restriction enzyme HsdR N-terminal domain-containing protein [Polyangia bacterium]
MAIPAKVAARVAAGIKRFQPVLSAAKSRDVNESDTVVIVMDMLQEVFGYDKYSDITSEHAIKGTYCDLAIKFEGALQMLLEVKAIGLELKDSHVKQAVDYAANQGTEWVVLTNGIRWRIYKVIFAKPIDNELVVELNLLELNPKNEDHLDLVWLLAKEGWQKKGLGEYQMHREALSRFFLGAVLLSDPVLEVVRRELRRLTPGAKIEVDEIEAVLRQDVIKREVIEGEKADEARKQLGRAASRALKAKSKATDDPPVAPPSIVMQKPATTGDKPDA